MSKQIDARTPAARSAPRRSAVKKAAKTAAVPRRGAVKKAAQAAPAPRRPKAAAAEAASDRGAAADMPRAKAAAVAEAAAPRADDLAATASANTLTFNPLIGLRADDISAGAGSLLKMVAASPRGAAQQYGRYLSELASILGGKSELAADPKDKRFADPGWKSNPFYKALMQGHLAAQKELGAYIASSDSDKREKGRAQFFASLVTDALAASNWLFGNPAAVRKIVDTGGKSLVDGAKNMLTDLREKRSLPASVDASGFKVGENVATTPGQVVLRIEQLELIQYTPTTPQVYRRPIVMVPPQVNKFYAFDLSPEKSLLKWALDSGLQVFVISWRNPTAEQRDWGIDTYAMAIDQAVDAAREITGSPDVNIWGSCSGGMTLAAYLGYLAGIGDRKVANSSWAVCILDTQSATDETTLGLFSSPATIAAARKHSASKGVVDGAEMATMFAWLRPNDLIWNYWVNNYLLGNKPPAYDVLAWNADTTRLPARFHSDLLGLCERNPYLEAGAFEVAGVPIDLSKLDIGAYVIGGITDHITPWKGCYGTARLLGEDSTFVLANAGHLQSLLNPPGAPKSFFFTAPASVPDPDEWAKSATRHEGSWWPHWREWMQQRSSELVNAPAQLGSRKHKPLVAAPGEYVHVK
ncbi:MAG TPA: alpha/beta fold hydrolase [Burkholderiaceae bacterium]|nr:alpha/beta fold hydrolase [Burkholderiaceae bacterium]